MTAIVLGVALLVVIVYGAHRERENAKERRDLARVIDAMLDRIQAPDAAVHAAYLRAAPAHPKPPDTDAEDDAAFGRDITGELDDLLVVGLDT